MNINIYLNFFTCLASMFLAMIVSMYRWRSLDAMGKIFFAGIAWYFFAFLISEGALLYKNIFSNYATACLIVRNVQPVIENSLCVLFFHYAVPELKTKRSTQYLVALGWALWIACAIIFRNTENFNVYYGPYTNVVVIVLSIISLNKLLNKYDLSDAVKLPAFRFTCLMLFFYGCSFFFFVSYPFLLQNRQAELFAVYIMFRLYDIFYLGAGITYFFYPKKTLQIE